MIVPSTEKSVANWSIAADTVNKCNQFSKYFEMFQESQKDQHI